ncbi:hypothetical protein G5C41_21885 [Burkholderia pseudomallei]|uniref:hypothetical protein n=1 Tax=Burkholderia pseudomallei TaxID=28450 RepID=UPI001592ED1D|nr:hypothetical protein [Burkholderia pseudomallei]MBD2940088.1 hypothetical protein [Burkholderia pseudomallei]MBD2963866.1 hypothetical protein [Burkholderia pseudomallei]MBF3499146.1 hypothetical protein [Burkholderia pseudomallei]NVH70734.1 hypothetical protein [Burkholderia pseudomallei]
MFSTLSHVLPRVALLGEPLANAPFVDGEITRPFRDGFWLLPHSTLCLPLAASDTVIVEPDRPGSAGIGRRPGGSPARRWAAIPFSPLIDGILGGDVASPTRAGRRRPAAARRAKPV